MANKCEIIDTRALKDELNIIGSNCDFDNIDESKLEVKKKISDLIRVYSKEKNDFYGFGKVKSARYSYIINFKTDGFEY